MSIQTQPQVPRSDLQLDSISIVSLNGLSDEELAKYCVERIGYYQTFKSFQVLFPLSPNSLLTPNIFFNTIKDKEHILVIISTTSNLFSIYTADRVPSQKPAKAWECETSFVYEYYKGGNEQNPPVRYVNENNKKVYTFGQYDGSATFLYHGGIAVKNIDLKKLIFIS